MRRNLPAVLVAIAFLAACGAQPGAEPVSRPSSPSELQLPPQASPNAQAVVNAVRVCPGPVAPGDTRCHALVVVDANGAPAASTAPRGYGPTDLQAAYALATAAASNGGGQTIAIVDAYDHPSVESDLTVYRSTYGLPPCTSATGCFRKVDQNGGTRYPRANCGWAQEIALDVQMASAICPNCKILLVEANSSSFANLATAVSTAFRLGATVISNSYGGSEFSSELSYSTYYDRGIPVTASSGDGGYGVEVPAAYNAVVAVGGTSLKRASNGRGWTETVWSGAGSGCSAYVGKPSWQKDTGCSRRTVADVAAVADPNTGVAVYDSYSCQGAKGWLQFGGTSVSAPIIASIYALAGNAGANAAQSVYTNASSLWDVISGSNGTCGSYLCAGASGYDGPTGNGTPNAIAAF